MSGQQIFGWTEPETPAQGYVETLVAFRRDDGLIDVEVRNRAGATVRIAVEPSALMDLGAEALQDGDFLDSLQRAKAFGALLSETVKTVGENRFFHLTQVGDITRAEVFPDVQTMIRMAEDAPATRMPEELSTAVACVDEVEADDQE